MYAINDEAAVIINKYSAIFVVYMINSFFFQNIALKKINEWSNHRLCQQFWIM